MLRQPGVLAVPQPLAATRPGRRRWSFAGKTMSAGPDDRSSDSRDSLPREFSARRPGQLRPDRRAAQRRRLPPRSKGRRRTNTSSHWERSQHLRHRLLAISGQISNGGAGPSPIDVSQIGARNAVVYNRQIRPPDKAVSKELGHLLDNRDEQHFSAPHGRVAHNSAAGAAPAVEACWVA